MARDDVFDFGNPFDPQKRKLDGKFDGPKPLDSVWDVPGGKAGVGLFDAPKKPEGPGWFDPPKGGSLLDVPEAWKAKAKAKEKARGGAKPAGAMIGSVKPARQVDRRNGAEAAKMRGRGQEPSTSRSGIAGALLVAALIIVAMWLAASRIDFGGGDGSGAGDPPAGPTTSRTYPGSNGRFIMPGNSG